MLPFDFNFRYLALAAKLQRVLAASSLPASKKTSNTYRHLLMKKYQVPYCIVFSVWYLQLSDGKVLYLYYSVQSVCTQTHPHAYIFQGSNEVCLSFPELHASTRLNKAMDFFFLNRIQDGNSEVSLLLCFVSQIKVIILVLFRIIHFFTQRKT